MQLKPMPEAELIRILSTQEDVLTPKVQLVFPAKPESCPQCGGAFAPWFEEGVNRLRHRCVGCGFTRDAETGLVTDLGHPEKTRDITVKMVSTPPAGSGTGRR